MIRCILPLLFASLMLFGRASDAQQQPPAPPQNGLLLVFDQIPPWVEDTDGATKGFFADILREMSKLSGVDITFAALPWVRALALSGTVPDVCAIPASMTPEREALFTWIGPVYRSEWKFFAVAESAITIGSLEDVRRYKVGVKNGSAQEKFLIQAGGVTLEPVSTDELNFKKLLANRIDLWAISAEVPWQYEKRTDRKIKAVYTFRSGPVGIGCNPRSDGGKIDRMRSALAALQADNRIEAIVQRFALTQ